MTSIDGGGGGGVLSLEGSCLWRGLVSGGVSQYVMLIPTLPLPFYTLSTFRHLPSASPPSP